ncbi:HEAT repeat domain-containing protein [Limnoglobus roseus]|uniref:HEAT repeat domain-containing protein n=1 Tax=Limnoglobus roseus TaxID=2598579 RepID=A0A5C1AD05_9BACT|nr:HEAT repeat domain-containing protein [Limnoglobus roseus]QEL14994.1 hypothetical protein PX52LOC_01899 [Limnoglobus roseus]
MMNTDAVFYRAIELLKRGDLARIKTLFASSDAAVKAAVLNGLWGEPGGKPEVGPGVVALAVEGAAHPSPEVRRMACSVFQNQDAWGVDVSPAIGPLLALLGDADAEVRRTAAYATGNVCRRRFDWSPHFAALRRLLSDPYLYLPEAAAWALAKMSRAGHDIGPAIGPLVRVLSRRREYGEPRKQAAKALLHYARKSAAGRDRVRRAVDAATLDGRRKEVTRFLEQLGAL